MSRKSIITEDLTKCIECGRSNVQLHEIFYGRNRKKSIKHGLVIPLCRELHHNGNLVGIHTDPDLNQKWRIIGQTTWQEVNDKTEEDFIKEFGRSYL